MSAAQYVGTTVSARVVASNTSPDGDWTLDPTDHTGDIVQVGVLYSTLVEDLDYTQYVVNGHPVDPDTIAPIAHSRATQFRYDVDQARVPAAPPARRRERTVVASGGLPVEQFDGTVEDVDATLDLSASHERLARYVAEYEAAEFRGNPNQPRHPAGSSQGGRWAPSGGVAVADYVDYTTVDGEGGRFDVSPGFGANSAHFDWIDDTLTAQHPYETRNLDHADLIRMEVDFVTDADGNILEANARWSGLGDEPLTEEGIAASAAAIAAFEAHFEGLGINAFAPEARHRIPEVGDEGWTPKTAVGKAFTDVGSIRDADGNEYTIKITSEDAYGALDAYTDPDFDAGQAGQVRGIILDADGNEVANFDRSFDGYVVKNNSFNVDVQGLGIGTGFLDATEDALRAYGAGYAELQAVDVGRYAWASRGYEYTGTAGGYRDAPTYWIEAAREYMTDLPEDYTPQQVRQLEALDYAWRSGEQVFPIDVVAIAPEFKHVLLDGPSWYGRLDLHEPRRVPTLADDEDDFAVELRFDPNQPRDDHGRWTPVGVASTKGGIVVTDDIAKFASLSPELRLSSPAEWFTSDDEFAAARRLADHKAANVPKPTPEQIAKNLAAEERARAGEGRPGGWGRGNSYTRRERAEALFREFGGEHSGYCPCTGCGIKVSPGGRDGHAVMQQDKILTTREGGTYGTAKSGFPNLVPACGGCNNARNATPHPVRPKWETERQLTGLVASGAPEPVATAFPLGWDDPDFDTIGRPVRGHVEIRNVDAWFGTYVQTVVGGEVVDPATLDLSPDSDELACELHEFRGCQSPACAPPPAGTGGSLPGGGSGSTIKHGSTLADIRAAMLPLDDGEDMGESLFAFRDAAAEYVGGMLTDAYTGAVGDDWKVDVQVVKMTEDGGTWAVEIRHPDDYRVVTMRRDLEFRQGDGIDTSDEWVVKHDRMDVSDDFQNRGIGQALTDAAEDVYRQLGVSAIELNAASIGRYAWASAGYDWANPHPRRVAPRLDRAAEIILNSSASPAQQDQVMNEIAGLRQRVDDGDLPIPYEVAMIGRGVWADADGVWPGKQQMLTGDGWNGRKEL